MDDVKHWRHRVPKAPNRARTIYVLTALAILVGASFAVSTVRSKPAADGTPAVAGTYTCVVVANGDGFGQSCVPVSPSGTPTAPPSPSASPTPTVSPSPTATTPPPTTVPPTTPPATTPPATTPPVTTPPPTTVPPTSPSPAGCPVAGTNVPGGADPWGGCWPGPGNTGVPVGATLTAYTGSCTIIGAGTVLDHKLITCATLDIRAAGVVISNSMLNGTDVTDENSSTASFTISDSTVQNGAREQCACIGYHDMTVLRVNDIGGNRGMYCELRCTITDSWSHGRQLQGAQHGSGIREEQNTTITHSAFACDYPIANDATGLGCSADLTGYPDFAPIKNNTIKRNLLLASITDSFCMYGGNTGGKPSSSDPTNATNQVFVDNVFQRGGNGKCGAFGPVTDFATNRTGNVWQNNRWDSGELIPAA